jgi:hypothetical protein
VNLRGRDIGRLEGFSDAVFGFSVGLATAGVGLSIGFPGWVYMILGPLCWANGALAARGRARLAAAAAAD